MSASAASAAHPFKATIRVEGKSRTLVKQRKVTLADAPIIKDGNPAHSCSGQAAIGALQAGTGGNWTGTWYEGLGYSADTIMGNKPAAPGYFELWINRKLSPTGLCDSRLQAGDQVLMFVQDCTYDPALGRCKNPVTPLGIRVARRMKVNRVRTIKVVDYAGDGTATAEPGATVYVNGRRLGRTNRRGTVKVQGTRTGVVTIYARKANKAKSEVAAVRIVR